MVWCETVPEGGGQSGCKVVIRKEGVENGEDCTRHDGVEDVAREEGVYYPMEGKG